MALQVTADIVISQNTVEAPPGYVSGRRDDLVQGEQITLVNLLDNIDVISHEWQISPAVGRTIGSYGVAGAFEAECALTPLADPDGYGDVNVKLIVYGNIHTDGRINRAETSTILGIRKPEASYGPGMPLPHPLESDAGGIATAEAGKGFRDRMSEAILALRSIIGPTDPTYTQLTFRPGGANSGSEHNSLSGLMSAFADIPGWVRIFLDDSISPIVINDNIDFENRAELFGLQQTSVTSTAGATIAGVRGMRDIELVLNTTLGPGIVGSATPSIDDIELTLNRTSVACNSSSNAAIELVSSESTIVLQNKSSITGSHPFIDPAGSTMKLHLSGGSIISTSMFTGTGEIDVSLEGQANQISTTQAGFSGTFRLLGGYLGTWVANVTYSVGAFVTSSSVQYMSIINNNLNYTPAGNPSRWLAL